MTGIGETLLTLDLGNSACKACLWVRRGGAFEVEASSAWERGAALGSRIAEWLGRERADAIERAGLASVASDEAEASLRDALGRERGLRLEAPDSGLANATRTPARVGADRLYAARGAFELLGRSAIVVDAGTAVTVDALLVADEPRPTFAGGAIAPGPRLLADALAGGTARLPRIELRGPVDALGRDTPSAIAAGVVHGLRGAVRELATRIAAETGIAGAPIVVTGGARALLLDPPHVDPPLLGALADEHLVHRGLCAALLDEPGAARTARHGLR